MTMWGYPQRAEFLVIPIATLFTITQLRSTMPGAPDFGAVIGKETYGPQSTYPHIPSQIMPDSFLA